MDTSLRPRKQLNYKALNDGEKIENRFSVVSKPIVLEGEYYIDRLIWRKADKEKQKHLYLVKWRGYPITDSTWEPEAHIPEPVLREYKSPVVSDFRKEEFARNFEEMVQARLKSKNPQSIVHVDLDVFRSCFGHKPGLYNLEDFQCLGLPEHWYYRLNRDGTGRKLRFPVRLTPKLLVRNIFVKERGQVVPKASPVERCVIFSCTEACSVQDV